MQTISTICAVFAGITMVATPVFLIVWIIRMIRKKSSKQWRKTTLISIGCFFIFLLAGTFTDPATYCDHEYELVETKAATCEKAGYEKYHCSLCNRDKTDKIKKLGHDMVDERRVEPSDKENGEYVQKCTRCGYEKIEILKKLDSSSEKSENITNDDKKDEAKKPKETAEVKDVTETNAPLNTWEKAFENAGFSENEIAGYRTIFETVGIMDLHDVDIVENGIMHIVRGKIYDSTNLQLNVTLENREIIYIEIAGIPTRTAEPYINWRGKLKVKTVNTKKSVTLYSDTEGGYMAVLDWDSKTIYEYKG